MRVLEGELADTAKLLRARFGSTEFDNHFGTNRPEDVEVHPDGTVYVALTNNTGSAVKDSHGSVRKMAEAGNDPTAMTFTWEDYAAGGPRPTDDPTRKGFSSPDNLVFDSQENLWVVTDISSSRLNKENEYKYHANNAMFMVPTKGPNAGVAFRFANGPVEAELTGPYFTPDERTLFINVQHPGEETGGKGTPGDESTYTSWWPDGNKTAGQNPSEPKPSLVAVTKLAPADPGTTSTGGNGNGDGAQDGGGQGAPVVPPPRGGAFPAGENGLGPRLNLLSSGRQKLAALRGQGFLFELIVDEACELELTLRGRLTRRQGRGRGRLRIVAEAQRTVTRPGTYRIRLRSGAALRLLLRREAALPGLLHVRATDAAGNVSTRTKEMTFK